MRSGILFILIILSSCSLSIEGRRPSSQQSLNFGAVDISRSLVQVFPSQKKDESFYLYVQLKDVNGKFVDCGPEEFSLKSKKGKKLNYSFERSLKGHYFLTIHSSELNVKHINLFVQNKPLMEQFKLQLNRPVPVHTKMKIIKNAENTLSVELLLRDKENKPVELPERPEILLEGAGHIENLQHVGEGIWHFEVKYPEENQIMYFSIRAMGVKIPNLYRYQHVEKHP